MRSKRLRRAGTSGALVAAALGTSMVVAPASASAVSEWKCYGTQVERCATVWWDEAEDTYRARAKITDMPGGGAYEVKVTNVKLINFDGDRLVTVKSKQDYDGWHDTEDLAGTATVDPCDYGNPSFEVKATFSWRGAGSGEKTWSPDQGWSMFCD
ncbi:hypothetical protein [Prauserella cavernicola]|uniref:Secreted protein n=1 Tax=Prauserella cavernicola TaxID=2800127 RepID=A0A934QW19_9PSEU|nr:hypothetical protein [Prauserella cavernicola]MBK1787426.1 hypothetical protein [Prauserella cavernicola]